MFWGYGRLRVTGFGFENFTSFETYLTVSDLAPTNSHTTHSLRKEGLYNQFVQWLILGDADGMIWAQSPLSR